MSGGGGGPRAELAEGVGFQPCYSVVADWPKVTLDPPGSLLLLIFILETEIPTLQGGSKGNNGYMDGYMAPGCKVGSQLMVAIIIIVDFVLKKVNTLKMLRVVYLVGIRYYSLLLSKGIGCLVNLRPSGFTEVMLWIWLMCLLKAERLVFSEKRGL